MYGIPNKKFDRQKTEFFIKKINKNYIIIFFMVTIETKIKITIFNNIK